MGISTRITLQQASLFGMLTLTTVLHIQDTFTIAGGYIYAQMGENQYHNPNTGEFGHSEFDCFDAYNGTEIWSLPIENGAPATVQCNAYGNLYLIPTTSAGEARSIPLIQQLVMLVHCGQSRVYRAWYSAGLVTILE